MHFFHSKLHHWFVGPYLGFCQVNNFMMSHQGMNMGGISAPFNDTLVDYKSYKIGLKAKAALVRYPLFVIP